MVGQHDTAAAAPSGASTDPTGPGVDEPGSALRGFLAEEIVVFDLHGRVKARLGPPGGLLGSPGRIDDLLGGTCHPDDIDRLAGLGAAVIDAEPGWTRADRFRLQHAEGSWHWYEVRAWNQLGVEPVDGLAISVREMFDQDGSLVDAEDDVDELVPSRAEAAWVASLVLDRQLVVRHATAAVTVLFDMEADELVGRPMTDLVIEEDRVHLLSGAANLRAGGERMVVCRLQPAHGPEIVTEIRLLGGSRTPLQLITAVLTDRTNEAALVRLATTDPLTGLANRVRVMDALEGHLAQGSDVSVIYADVDGLKPLNDTHGHAVGDQLLVEIAQQICDVVGPGPVVGRMGGDEFVVVCAGGHSTRADALAEALRTRIRVDHFDSAIPATVSAGSAHAAPGESAADLLHRADAAMFVHKRGVPRTGRR